MNLSITVLKLKYRSYMEVTAPRLCCLHSTVQYSTVQYSTVQYSTVLPHLQGEGRVVETLLLPELGAPARNGDIIHQDAASNKYYL